MQKYKVIPSLPRTESGAKPADNASAMFGPKLVYLNTTKGGVPYGTNQQQDYALKKKNQLYQSQAQNLEKKKINDISNMFGILNDNVMEIIYDQIAFMGYDMLINKKDFFSLKKDLTFLLTNLAYNNFLRDRAEESLKPFIDDKKARRIVTNIIMGVLYSLVRKYIVKDGDESLMMDIVHGSVAGMSSEAVQYFLL